MIDTDFASSARYYAINKVREKYGNEYVAQVMTFTNLQSKAIMAAIGKCMDIDENIINSYKDRLIEGKRISECKLVDSKTNEKEKKFIEYCSRLEGLPRSTSLHAGGVVICPDDMHMEHFSALMLSKDGETAIQCTKETVEEIGLVKYDFLATATMDIIADTIKSVGYDYYNYKFDFEDEKVWDYICTGDTGATFQTESNFMTEILKKVQPRNIEDLCAVISLGRPDTVGFTDDFVAIRKGEKEPDYYDELLEPVLKNTSGLMLYQENVMKIAKVFAGYSDGEADKLRKGLGKKDKNIVKQEADKFYNRSLSLNRNAKHAKRLADVMSTMGGYLFNKNHGISYALVSYMTFYLKYYHPLEFMTSVINNQKKDNGSTNFDKVNRYLKFSKNMGIKIINPDINYSSELFVAYHKENAIMYGFSHIKGLSSNGVQLIMENRPFSTYCEFIDKCGLDMSKSDVIALIKSGAFNKICGNDKLDLFKYYYKFRLNNGKETKYKPIKIINKTHIQNMIDNGLILVTEQGNKQHCIEVLNKYRKQTGWNEFKNDYLKGDELDWEMETLNVHLSGDPFKNVFIPNWDKVDIEEIGYVGGVISTKKEVTVKRGKSAGQKMCFLNISVKDKLFDIVVFADKYRRDYDSLKTGNCIVCQVEKSGELSGSYIKSEMLGDYKKRVKGIKCVN